MSVAAPSLLQMSAPQAPRDLALALKVGQVLDAMVIALADDGTATLQLDAGVLATKLPASVPIGASLHLQVKSAGPSPELSLLRLSLPATPAQPTLPTTPSGAASPMVPQSTPIVRAAVNAAVIAVATPALPQGQLANAATAAPLPATSLPSAPMRDVPAGPAPPVITPSASLAVAAEPQASGPPDASPPTPQPAPAAPRAEGQAAQSASAQPQPAAPAASAAVSVSSQAAAEPPPPATGGAAQAAAVPRAVAEQAAASPPAVPPPPAAAVPLRIPYAAAQRPAETASSAAFPMASATAPASPAEAVARALPQALAVQNSAGALLQMLAALATGGPRLPLVVQQIVRQILGLRLAAGAGLSAADLAQTIANSGPLLEARLANGLQVGRDMKALLLALKAALAPYAGPDSAAPSGPRLPPPLRDLTPRAPEPAGAPVLADDLPGLAKLVNGQADAALARIRLAQMAALPDADPTQPPHGLRTEIPLLVGAELVMAQLHIAPDGRSTRREQKRGWTVKFAMNFAETGEVGAEVGIFDHTIDVSLWALDESLAQRMADLLPQLGEAIAAGGLRPGRLRVRTDAPGPGASRMGGLLDSLR